MLKKYWDLILIITLSALLDFIIIYFPENLLRTILGLPYILFFPGYVFINALFPKKKSLDNLERIALSFGLSIAIVPLIGLMLNYTPWGIRLIPILVSITVFNICFGLISIHYRNKVREPWIPEIKIEYIKNDIEWDKSDKIDKILSIILILAIVSSIVTLVYVTSHPKNGEKFTEFYILSPDGKAHNYPTNISVGENATVILGIANHEYKTINYSVEVWLVNLTYNTTTNQTNIHDMYLIDTFNIELPHKPIDIDENWTPQWEINYTFKINKTGYWQLWFLLYKDKKPSLPKSINNDYSKTNATSRILEAIDEKILSLKLNIHVNGEA